MAGKTYQVHLRVSPEQHANMKAKAGECGISLSRLVLLAVDAYLRAFGEDVSDCSAVAVNYGVWLRVDGRLALVEGRLPELSRNLNWVRRALAGMRREGGHDDESLARVAEAADACRRDVAAMRGELARCVAVLDGVYEAAHMYDPMIEPFECAEGADEAPSAAEGE